MIEASIIIPVFNLWNYTQKCLESVVEFTPSLGDPHTTELIVVDNGSTDSTAQGLAAFAAQFPAIRIHSFSSNLGFNVASNKGAELASGKFLVFLNNDTLVTKHWLPSLLHSFSQPAAGKPVGVVGGKLLYPDTQTINHCGYVYNRPLERFYPIYHNLPRDFSPTNRVREFQAVLGACLAIRKELFHQVGGFGEYGLEDIDLCLKARAAGYKAIVDPACTIYHYGSATFRTAPPESIFSTTTDTFNLRWPKDSIMWDDLAYYKEDGVQVETDSDGKIKFGYS